MDHITVSGIIQKTGSEEEDDEVQKFPKELNVDICLKWDKIEGSKNVDHPKLFKDKRLKEDITIGEKEILQTKVRLDDGTLGDVVTCFLKNENWTYFCHPCLHESSNWEIFKDHIDSKKHAAILMRASHSRKKFLMKSPNNDLTVNNDSDYATCNIQEKLDDYSKPLLGLEYLVESETGFIGVEEKPMYYCLLCDILGKEEQIMIHLSSKQHYLKYFLMFFPTTLEKLKRFATTTCSITSLIDELIDHIAARIETDFGRLKPLQVERESFDQTKFKILSEIDSRKHFRETNDESYTECVCLTHLHHIVCPVTSYQEKWVPLERKYKSNNRTQNTNIQKNVSSDGSDLKDQRHGQYINQNKRSYSQFGAGKDTYSHKIDEERTNSFRQREDNRPQQILLQTRKLQNPGDKLTKRFKPSTNSAAFNPRIQQNNYQSQPKVWESSSNNMFNQKDNYRQITQVTPNVNDMSSNNIRIPVGMFKNVRSTFPARPNVTEIIPQNVSTGPQPPRFHANVQNLTGNIAQQPSTSNLSPNQMQGPNLRTLNQVSTPIKQQSTSSLNRDNQMPRQFGQPQTSNLIMINQTSQFKVPSSSNVNRINPWASPNHGQSFQTFKNRDEKNIKHNNSTVTNQTLTKPMNSSIQNLKNFDQNQINKFVNPPVFIPPIRSNPTVIIRSQNSVNPFMNRMPTPRFLSNNLQQLNRIPFGNQPIVNMQAPNLNISRSGTSNQQNFFFK